MERVGTGAGRERRGDGEVRGAVARVEAALGAQLRVACGAPPREYVDPPPLLQRRRGPIELCPGGTLRTPVWRDPGRTGGTPPPLAPRQRHAPRVGSVVGGGGAAGGLEPRGSGGPAGWRTAGCAGQWSPRCAWGGHERGRSGTPVARSEAGQWRGGGWRSRRPVRRGSGGGTWRCHRRGERGEAPGGGSRRERRNRNGAFAAGRRARARLRCGRGGFSRTALRLRRRGRTGLRRR